jgi:hypothetical protein
MAEVPVENDKSVESAMTMRIDYSQSISEVYQYLVKFMINRGKNLDILSITSTHRDANSLDPWAPDWRVPTHPFHWTATWSILPAKWDQQASPKQSHKTKQISVSLRLADSTSREVQELVGLTSHTIPHPPQATTADMSIFDPERDVRQFAITECGMGLVPKNTQIEDKVWILYGSRLPIVLTRVESFQYGPRYLPGFMLGKAIKLFQEQQGNENHTLILV